MAREYFCAYHSFLESLTPYGDAECGRLFRACLQYSMSGEEPDLRGNERFIWPTLKQQIDRDINAYAATCATNRGNGAKGGRPPKTEKTERFIENRTVISETEKTQEEEKGEGKEEGKEKDKDKGEGKKASRAAARFTPPTIEEVQAYCKERNSPVDPVQFWAYFDAGDWTDAKGNKVRNWKQKLLTWEKFDKLPQRPVKPNQVVASMQYNWKDMDGLLAGLDNI